MFGVLYAAEASERAALEAVAREFSPRIECHGPREIMLDLSGLARLFGDAREIAAELRRTAADRGLRVRIAIAATRAAARLIVRHRAGATVIEPGGEADALSLLPLSILANVSNASNASNASNVSNVSNDLLSTFRCWGLRTLGDLAALPADDVAGRLGLDGVACQPLSRGEAARPRVPPVPSDRFEQTLELEWPIEGLEPLSFVLGRLMDPLSAHLERRDRGAAVLHVRLRLVTRTVHERTLQLPAPMRDARTLRTLALLDLESHPPDAAIDRVTVAVDPTPGRIVQFSLLTRPLPSPEQLSTLAARLAALMGEGRCGSPIMVDSWRPGAFAMTPFAPRDSAVRSRNDTADAVSHKPRSRGDAELEKPGVLRASVSPRPVTANVGSNPTLALRRFRTPIPARVRVEEGRPVRVIVDRRGFGGGRVDVVAGPWRTSGAWWESHGWDRDEWDVALSDGATYRLFRERLPAEARSPQAEWFIEGIVD